MSTATCNAYEANVTYYCLDGLTASGTVPVEGRTAACNDLPLGTEVLIDGQPFIVEDRIGWDGDGYIDIYAEDEDWCIEMGVQTAEVEVIGLADDDDDDDDDED